MSLTRKKVKLKSFYSATKKPSPVVPDVTHDPVKVDMPVKHRQRRLSHVAQTKERKAIIANMKKSLSNKREQLRICITNNL